MRPFFFPLRTETGTIFLTNTTVLLTSRVLLKVVITQTAKQFNFKCTCTSSGLSNSIQFNSIQFTFPFFTRRCCVEGISVAIAFFAAACFFHFILYCFTPSGHRLRCITSLVPVTETRRNKLALCHVQKCCHQDITVPSCKE